MNIINIDTVLSTIRFWNLPFYIYAYWHQHNTPDSTTKMSSVRCVFGRPVKDLIPLLPTKYHQHPTWRESLELQEQALDPPPGQMESTLEGLIPIKNRLPWVHIQNQMDPHPRNRNQTSIVVNVRQFHK